MTIEVSRRQLMASMGGMVLASFALPPALRKALDNAPPSVLSSAKKVPPVSDVKHVVVLMQENRSFDHYFGAMPGVRGFADPTVSRQVFFQTDACEPEGVPAAVPRRHHSTSNAQAASRLTSHSWGPLHDSWDGGKMDGFVTAHIAADGSAGQYTMAYFKRDDIPFQWALADAFTVCDGYHCVDARPDLAEPALPDDRPGRSGRRERRPGHQQLRADGGLLLADLPGDADRGRRLLEAVPGERQLRHERP